MENKINNPEDQQQQFTQEEIQEIHKTMEDEADDWFIDQILNNTQPDFWWVY